MTYVAIVDYGMGNVVSVSAAVQHLGWQSKVTSDPAELELADRIILPGVGAFGDAMRNLNERGLVEPLRELVEVRKKPILGICLGAQLLALESEEYGTHKGLGWIDAVVRRLRVEEDGLRVPHVGWNGIDRRGDSRLLKDVSDDALFYYVHSYVIECRDESVVAAYCGYGQNFTAVVEKGNVAGAQFHPEKSQRHGLQVLGNFLGNDFAC